MIASGLHESQKSPTNRNTYGGRLPSRRLSSIQPAYQKTEEEGKRELCQLAEFAINYRFTILRFNKDHQTNFNVQIGLAYWAWVLEFFGRFRG